MTQSELTISRVFDDLANEVEREPSLSVRIHRVDGSSVEGQVLYFTATDLVLIDSVTDKQINVAAREFRAVDVCLPRRGREWMLAAGAIPGTTALLIAYAQLPWVRPQQGHIVIGFLILCAIVYGLASIPMVHRAMVSWLTKWQRLSPTAPDEEM